jgi:hypothetical protein
MAIFENAKEYPEIYKIVHTDLPKFALNLNKLKVLMNYAQLSEKKARQTLQANSGPKLIIKKNLGQRWGHYKSGDEIWLNMLIADQYEELHREYRKWRIKHPPSPHSMVPEASKPIHLNFYFDFEADSQNRAKQSLVNETKAWESAIAQARLQVEATILHEIVHWGDNLDGWTEDRNSRMNGWKDLGHEFVAQAYRGEIGIKKGPQSGLMQTDYNVEGWLGFPNDKQFFWWGNAYDIPIR